MPQTRNVYHFLQHILVLGAAVTDDLSLPAPGLPAFQYCMQWMATLA